MSQRLTFKMSHHKRTLEEEEDEIVKELCTTNGINLSRLLEDGMATMQLETFFSGYPRMVGLRHFPNLLSLVIVGQTVDRMENLKSVPQLRELWIVECKLQKIECLQHVTHLQKLYLYSNEISRIENLEYLSELEVLWLHGNKIKDIEGLENLKQLKELNLAENRIEKIGNSLSALANLESLELSGNKIWSFSDLTNLTKLTRLVELGLKSPMYSPAPVGELCNYQTHILYHLPNLNRLDTYDVTTRQLKENSEGAKPPKGVKELAKVRSIVRHNQY